MVQPLITARTLDTIHALQARLVPDRAVILTPDPAPAPGTVGTPSASAPIPCRALRRRAQAAEGPQGPQIMAVEVWRVTLAGIWTVTPEQQLRVTFLDRHTGAALGTTLFEVSSPSSLASFGTETAVECRVVSSSGME
jgi:hypothetical protein